MLSEDEQDVEVTYNYRKSLLEHVIRSQTKHIIEVVLSITGVSVGFTFWGVVFYQSFTLVEPGQ